MAKSDTTERLHFHFSLSCTGEGNGNPLQCSCLENPRDGGAWWAAVHGVEHSRTRLKRLSSSSSSSNMRAKCFSGGDAFSGELNWVFIPMMSFAAEGVSKFLEIRAAQKWSKGGHRTGTGAAKVATRGPLGHHIHSSHGLPYSHWSMEGPGRGRLQGLDLNHEPHPPAPHD